VELVLEVVVVLVVDVEVVLTAVWGIAASAKNTPPIISIIAESAINTSPILSSFMTFTSFLLIINFFPIFSFQYNF